MFTGSIPALITPFTNGDVDWSAYENLIAWQIQEGSDALVPCGTTGESPTLSHEEHKKLVERCVQVADGQVPVIAGTGSNSTREAIELTQHAKEAGADAALIVAPYYNKPTPQGLIAHYKAISDAVALPIIVYNIPGRSVIDIKHETLRELVKIEHVIGIKDATNDLARPMEQRLEFGPGFCLLSGEDATVAGYLAQGGNGIISVLANIAPKMSSMMHKAWRMNDIPSFESMRNRLMPLADALFCESSPAPAKYAASRLGMCSDEVRLPLVPASDKARTLIDAAMEHAGIKAVA